MVWPNPLALHWSQLWNIYHAYRRGCVGIANIYHSNIFWHHKVCKVNVSCTDEKWGWSQQLVLTPGIRKREAMCHKWHWKLFPLENNKKEGKKNRIRGQEKGNVNAGSWSSSMRTYFIALNIREELSNFYIRLGMDHRELYLFHQ